MFPCYILSEHCVSFITLSRLAIYLFLWLIIIDWLLLPEGWYWICILQRMYIQNNYVE